MEHDDEVGLLVWQYNKNNKMNSEVKSQMANDNIFCNHYRQKNKTLLLWLTYLTIQMLPFSWTIHEVFGIVQFIVWCPTALFKNIDDESKMLVAFNRLNHKT